jgi:hypothetical protein
LTIDTRRFEEKYEDVVQRLVIPAKAGIQDFPKTLVFNNSKIQTAQMAQTFSMITTVLH